MFLETIKERRVHSYHIRFFNKNYSVEIRMNETFVVSVGSDSHSAVPLTIVSKIVFIEQIVERSLYRVVDVLENYN